MDFLKTALNWVEINSSNIISVFGIFITILFSWRASISALNAEQSAKNAKLQIAKISATGVFQECVHLGELARVKIDSGNWEDLYTNLTEIRRKLISLVATAEYTNNTEDQKVLTGVSVQIKLLMRTVNKIKHNVVKSPSKVNLHDTLGDQLDLIQALHERAKVALGEAE